MPNKIVAILLLFIISLAACAQSALKTETPGVDKALDVTPVITDAPAPTLLIPKSGGTFSDQEPARSPLDELEGEDEMIRGEVFIDRQEILLMESYPVQVALQVSGNLPTPCHMLRAEVSEPDSENNINVELFSLSEPGVICVQVLQPFETSIPLGSYTEGDYTVYVNGEKVSEFSI